MATRDPFLINMSPDGHLSLPKAILENPRWRKGMRFAVEETPEGIFLKAVPIFPPTKPEDVAGCLAYKGKAKTLKDMDNGITKEVLARHARGRY